MKIHRLVIFAAFSLVIISCTAAAETRVLDLPAGKTPISDQMPHDSENSDLSKGEAVIIHDVQLNYQDPDSGSAEVEIDGSFPDGCTELSEVIRSRDGNSFTLHLMTTRRENAQCTMALEPFSISVPLDLNRFENGDKIVVNVYEFKLEFTIDRAEEPEQGGG